MDFPTLVYRVPGPYRGPDNSTFDFAACDDEARFEELAGAGWFATLPEALDPPKADEEPSDRALLEAEARRLGIGFNWKTSDEALAEKIGEANKGQSE